MRVVLLLRRFGFKKNNQEAQEWSENHSLGYKIMFEYKGLEDIIFMALYCVAAFSALLAAVYLLWRRGNAFVGDEIRSSRVLRRWTAALMLAIVASHVWWYAIGTQCLADDWTVRTITVIMLDHVTLVPLAMAVLLAMLQDQRRRLWPWLVAQVPVVVFGVMGIIKRDWSWGNDTVHLYQLLVVTAFVVYYIFAVWNYGKWLLDNYADLERKEVWQSLVFAVFLFVFYELYTSNAGEMMKEYMAQVITLVIIAFLVWRVETLQELEGE